jgi:hypothetical protein
LEGIHHDAEVLCIQLIYEHIIFKLYNDDYRIDII